ncbi:helix-turn-helix transcriptional regulator [Leucobacter albus]|uniref:Helix-turn-helix transcriptional regulator n=1 Tax=Leucobacter albus TaxID=272210 RepID=A0ABW3TNA2_9MICO
MNPSTHTPAHLWNLEPLLSAGEVSDYLGIPVSTLYDWRTRDLGPRAHRIGKHLKYAVSDVCDWVTEAGLLRVWLTLVHSRERVRMSENDQQ